MDIKCVDANLWPFGDQLKVFVPEDNCVYIKSDYKPAEYETPSPSAEAISVNHPMVHQEQKPMSIAEYQPSNIQKRFDIHSAADFNFLKAVYKGI